jgi:phosphate-selective porin OprO/OprP
MMRFSTADRSRHSVDIRALRWVAVAIVLIAGNSIASESFAQSADPNTASEVQQSTDGTTVSSREAALEQRIKELEKVANERTEREAALEQRLKSLEKMLNKDVGVVPSSNIELQDPRDDPLPGEEAYLPQSVDLQPPGMAPVAPGTNLPSGASLAEKASAAANAGDEIQMPYKGKALKGSAGFGQGAGFVITTDDDEYQLQIHDLTQIDFRQYDPRLYPTNSSFGFPRQWLIFNGRLTKPLEYMVIINWGFTNINLLDAFVNINYDPRLQVKIGRFKTPWSYEFYAEPVNGLISPERSIYFNNLGENRDTGVMVWGQVLDKTTDYAVGVFNGVRNGYVDNNDAKATMAYFNTRPLERTGIDLFKYWNVGGSMAYNVYNDLARPELYRTNVPYPGDSTMSPIWLQLNKDIYSFGSQQFYGLHSALYYNSLSLIGEWYGGYETYAHKSNLLKGDKIVNNGWYVQAGYFLTGEHVTSRGVVNPLRPFNPKSLDGLGAFELAFRYANQTVDKTVFQFASQSKWTNDTDVLDLGINWYWNSNIKFYAGWERAMFGRPIQAAPGVNPSGPPQYWMNNSDMFWARLQLYF